MPDKVLLGSKVKISRRDIGAMYGQVFSGKLNLISLGITKEVNWIFSHEVVGILLNNYFFFSETLDN